MFSPIPASIRNMLIVKNSIATCLTNFFGIMTRCFVALYTMTIERISGNIHSIATGDVGISIGAMKPANMAEMLFIFFAPDHLAATAVGHVNGTQDRQQVHSPGDGGVDLTEVVGPAVARKHYLLFFLHEFV